MKFLLAIVVVFVTAFGFGGVAHADVNDFVVNNFEARYVIAPDKPGGSLLTEETIEVTFTDNNHGILRSIPERYQSRSTKLNIQDVLRDGAAEEYTTYSENGNKVLKIGKSDKTITGRHTYKIVYTQERIVNFKGDSPEFYWDVNGNDWNQNFEKVSATVEVKGGLNKGVESACYAGLLDSAQSKGVCSVSRESQNVFYYSTQQPLAAGETLTVAVALDGVPFVEPTFRDVLMDYKRDALGLLIGLVLFGVAFWNWLRSGKDYRGRGVVVPEYQPQKGLTPAEIGMLADYKVDGRDLTATLIDLAVRGYVRLHETESKVLFFTSRAYSVELLKPDFGHLKIHERNILEGIFTKFVVGELVDLRSISRTTMHSKVQSARSEIKKSLIETYGYLEEKSDKKMTVFVVIGSILFFVGFFSFGLLGTGGVLGILLGAVSFFAFGSAMQRRSHAGLEMYEKIEGLKMYMGVAEKDRLAMMQSVDRPFAEPTKTPHLYEKLLPFAVALGVEKSWSKQFDGLLTQSPDWVNSNSLSAFSGAALASSINGVTTSFGRSFESSSGGSSGGGSAGGGGGGGGGGGW